MVEWMKFQMVNVMDEQNRRSQVDENRELNRTVVEQFIELHVHGGKVMVVVR